MTEPTPDQERPEPQEQPEKVHGDPVHRVESEPVDADQEDAELTD
jgi:hypothetical protein